MDLLHLPPDVLLKILCTLEVQDILRAERICRTLREYSVNSKHIWLVKLHDLDVSRDPGIPPNVSVEDLPTEELRSIVIKAVRDYTDMTKSNSPTVSYILRKTINPSPPETMPSGASSCISQAKFIPGGRFLFVSWMIRMASPEAMQPDYVRSEGLCILDTEALNKRVWSYDPGKYHRKTRRYIYGYNFDLQRDGSIILALMTESDDGDEASELTGLFQVFSLSFDSVKKEFEGSPIYSSDLRVYRHRCCAGGTDCQVSGDYVALIDYADRVITLLKWGEGRTVEIPFARTGNQGGYRIWRNHLFYMDFKLQELRAVSITEAMLSSRKVVPKLEELDATTLQLDAVPDKDESIISGFPGNVVYSIYDTPWRNSSEAVFTILSQASTGIPHYTATRAKFHPLEADSQEWTWTFLSARTAKAPDSDSRTSYIVRGAMRSGRFLSWSQKKLDFPSMMHLPRDHPSLLRRLDLVVVDCEGLPLFPRLSDNMAYLLARADKESEYMKEYDGDNVGFRSAAHVEQFEKYTGAIVVARDIWSGKDFIEIYYPE